MARTTSTPEDDAIRKRAFELYADLDPSGAAPTLKSIAVTLGVSQPRVSYWMKADRWLERSRTFIAMLPDPTSDNIREQLRRDLAKHLRTLSGIIDGTGHDRIRVSAIAEFAKIAKQLGALDLDTPGSGTPSGMLAFDDNMDAGTQENA